MAGCEGYIALPKSLLLIRHPLLLVSPPAVERGNLLSWRRPRNHSTRGSGWHSSMVGMSPGRQCWAPVYDSEMGKNLAELDFEHKNDLLGWLGPYRSWILCWTMANAPLSLRWGGRSDSLSPHQSHQALTPIFAGPDNKLHPCSPLPSPNRWPQPGRAPALCI
jgi:hypothetical protein